MENSGQYLDYQLYKGASGNNRWGNGAANGARLPLPTQTPARQAAYLKVLLTVPRYCPRHAPPPGTYTDMIVVDVIF